MAWSRRWSRKELEKRPDHSGQSNAQQRLPETPKGGRKPVAIVTAGGIAAATVTGAGALVVGAGQLLQFLKPTPKPVPYEVPYPQKQLERPAAPAELPPDIERAIEDARAELKAAAELAARTRTQARVQFEAEDVTRAEAERPPETEREVRAFFEREAARAELKAAAETFWRERAPFAPPELAAPTRTQARVQFEAEDVTRAEFTGIRDRLREVYQKRPTSPQDRLHLAEIDLKEAKLVFVNKAKPRKYVIGFKPLKRAFEIAFVVTVADAVGVVETIDRAVQCRSEGDSLEDPVCQFIAFAAGVIELALQDTGPDGRMPNELDLERDVRLSLPSGGPADRPLGASPVTGNVADPEEGEPE